MDLTPGHNTAERQLATPIHLETTGTAYIALLASQALDTASNLSNKALTVDLRDASEASRLSFGVGAQENFYLSGMGSTFSTLPGTVDGSATYLMLLKIVSQDSSAPGNHDQIFLKTFRSGVDTIPATDAGLTWTLIGATSTNSSAVLDRIRLAAGSTATWTLDELRIGDTYGAVTTVVVPEPGSVALLLSAAAVWLSCRLRRRSGVTGIARLHG
jgi:hypothetical protein